MKAAQALVCVLATVILAARADAQVLYGATSNGNPGELFILDPANGNVIQDIGPLNDAGGTNYPITGLAFNPQNGVLYGSTGNSVAATAHLLVTINPATARVTPIGSFNVANGTMADIAFAASGVLYGSNSVAPNIDTVNLATGQATQVGGGSGLTGFSNGGGLALNASGAIYGSPQNDLFGTFDPTTGVYTQIGVLATPAGANTGYAAMAFNGSGILYGNDLGATPHLVTIDPATGTVTDIGPTVLHLDAIAFSPVPEPSTMALLLGPAGMSLLSVVRRRRR